MPPVVAAALYALEAYDVIALGAAAIEALSYAIVAVASVYTLREQQRKAENRAKDAYNASLRDRYQMMRSSLEERALVLGRARVSGPLMFIQSYGDKRQHLVFLLALAAHEIDAVETIYFNDEPVTLDGSGYVTGISRREEFSIAAPTGTFSISTAPQSGSVTATATYGTDVVPLTVTGVTGTNVSVSGARSGQTGLLRVTYQPNPCPYLSVTTQTFGDVYTVATGSDTFTLTQTPDAGAPISATQMIPGSPDSNTNIGVTVVGNSATISGGSPGQTVTISYQSTISTPLARVTKYLGAPGQTADAGMIAALPGVWTSAHTATGIAYLKIELEFNQDAFPGGIPNVSAVVRGLKCEDPRTGSTAWSDNPAVLTRAYAMHTLGAQLQSSQIDDASFIAAANVCDTSTNYVVGSNTFTRPLYRAGHVVKANIAPRDALNDLTQAMGGRWAFVDGRLRVVAGSYSAPVMALDETWLHRASPVQIQPHRNRPDVVNTVVGGFANEDRDYQVGPFPRVAPAAYIAEDGRELQNPITMQAVQWSGQAQYIAACTVRYGRQGMTLKVPCNLRAYPAQVFDVISVTLPRFGLIAKPFEVLETNWSLDGGIDLVLKEIDPSIWQMDAGFPAEDPAPNTRLPSPWGVPKISGLSASSGTAQLLKQRDGTIVSRILLTWSTLSDATINQAGEIEIRYGLATTNEDSWKSIRVPGTATQAYLEGVLDGGIYLIKARGIGTLARGDWSPHYLHQVVGKTAAPADVSGFAATVQAGGVKFSWAASTEVDYAETELRVGSSWGSAAAIFKGRATTYLWPMPTGGSYTVHARHRDTSGNVSTTSATVSLSFVRNDLRDLASVNFDARNDRLATAVVAPTVATDGTAVDHVLNSDASADVSFEWSWSGSEADIDGFRVMVYSSTSSSAYTPGTTPAAETEIVLPANKRAFIALGLSPTNYYTFAVRAYREVDPDIDASGVMFSSWVKSTRTEENPYRPSASVAWPGDVTGTVGGIPVANVNVWSAISGVSVATSDIQADAVTVPYSSSATGVTVTGETGVGGLYGGTTTTLCSVTFTAAANGTAKISAEASLTVTTPSTNTSGVDDYTTISTGLDLNGTTILGSSHNYQGDAQAGLNKTVKMMANRNREFDVVGGTTYTLYFRAQKVAPNVTVTADAALGVLVRYR